MTPQNPRSEDHDILIELRTLVQQILHRELREIKEQHNAALAQKADKAEVAEAMRRLDAHQKDEERYRDEIMRDMSTLKTDMRSDMKELRTDVKKLLWIAASAVGGFMALQAVWPALVKLL